ncbi:MAG: hypothetical protein WD768_00850, partial [Phycisphaeraceae bacterium]
LKSRGLGFCDSQGSGIILFMNRVRKSAAAYRADPSKPAPFQHWYRDNQVYFITARCRGRYRAFATDEAKAIFWEQFEKYTVKHQFTPWVTSLLDNHWHGIGYLLRGSDLGPMMKGIQGATAKLVNDLLQRQFEGGMLKHAPPTSEKVGTPLGRHVPFWYDSRNQSYFDGCLRNEKQGRLTYRYVLTQSVRHGFCVDPRDYPHTRVRCDVESAIAFATERRAFLYGVPYRRYGEQ